MGRIRASVPLVGKWESAGIVFGEDPPHRFILRFLGQMLVQVKVYGRELLEDFKHIKERVLYEGFAALAGLHHEFIQGFHEVLADAKG